MTKKTINLAKKVVDRVAQPLFKSRSSTPTTPRSSASSPLPDFQHVAHEISDHLENGEFITVTKDTYDFLIEVNKSGFRPVSNKTKLPKEGEEIHVIQATQVIDKRRKYGMTAKNSKNIENDESDEDESEFDDKHSGLQLSSENIEVVQMSKHTVSKSQDGGGLVIDKNRVNTLINLKEEAKKKQPYETSKLAQKFLFSTQNKNEEIKKQQKPIRKQSLAKKNSIVAAAVAMTNEIDSEGGTLGKDPLMMTPKIGRSRKFSRLGSVSEAKDKTTTSNNKTSDKKSSITAQ